MNVLMLIIAGFVVLCVWPHCTKERERERESWSLDCEWSNVEG